MIARFLSISLKGDFESKVAMLKTWKQIETQYKNKDKRGEQD